GAAAAAAREDAARTEAARVARERVAAEDAARRAVREAATAGAQQREQLLAEARIAEERLATAKRATLDVEARRAAAEAAATAARKELESSRATLATVEQQRTEAEGAATTAARKRGEAEAAATEASRKRSEAESAASAASRRRGEAESAAAQAAKARSDADQQRLAIEAQRKAAEDALREAQVARAAADKQRVVAEQSAAAADGARKRSEAGLAELTARRAAAERAAAELEQRSQAEARAQAEAIAATTRKASEAEVEKLRGDVARLADERKRAEADLASRRKAVVAQQAEADQLKTVAQQARDDAERAEARRVVLAKQHADEEQQLAALKAQRATLAKAPATVTAQPTVVAPQPTQPTTAVPTVRISDITFKGDDTTAEVSLTVSSATPRIAMGELTATHAELVIDDAELAQKLERKLDVTRFGSAVRSVSSFRDRRVANRVRLVAELSGPATPSFERVGNAIHWKLATADAARAGAVARHAPMRVERVPSPVVAGFAAASTPVAQQTVAQVPQGRRRIYHGATVSYDFKDASIHDLLRLIADTGHVNIVVPDSIDPKVTVRLNRVPWDQALEVILASHGLWYRRDGNLYRIATRKEIDAEDEAEAARRAAAVAAESPAPQVVPLNYASAAELKTKLEGMLSQKGSLNVDDRTNALIINDVAGNREQITRLALQLDTQTPQISIEARIVEARSTFLRQIGVQWGGRATAGAAGGNATGLVWPSSVGLIGGSEDQQTVRSGVAAPSDFAVNLPASTGSGEGGALGMSLGSVGGNFNINLRLSALEDSGTVRIISAPKITVLNNKEAKISQGVSIPISVVSASGTQTQFVQADLSLTVTPYVSQRDCAIAMSLNVTKNEPDFVNVGARGDPTILRKEAKTSMLVQDGETSVLGGIYTRNSGLAYKKIPFLGDLPVLGWLFKNRRENDDR
ncbi:MAG: type IV pilus secretin PilQ, partial [Proteobacteria bacterium]|nr:type IV pilus secretin PilQ [Pseudomonadota bacterium]